MFVYVLFAWDIFIDKKRFNEFQRITEKCGKTRKSLRRPRTWPYAMCKFTVFLFNRIDLYLMMYNYADAYRMAIGQPLFHNAVIMKRSKYHFISISQTKPQYQKKKKEEVLANSPHKIYCNINFTLSIFLVHFSNKNTSCLYHIEPTATKRMFTDKRKLLSPFEYIF